MLYIIFFFFQAEDGIRDIGVTGVQTCALPISRTELFAMDAPATRIAGASIAKSSVREAARPGSPMAHRLSTEDAIRWSSRLLSLRTSWKTKFAAGEARTWLACGSSAGADCPSLVPCGAGSGGLAPGCGSGLRRRRPPLPSDFELGAGGSPGPVFVLERCDVSRLQWEHQTIWLPSLS